MVTYPMGDSPTQGYLKGTEDNLHQLIIQDFLLRELELLNN